MGPSLNLALYQPDLQMLAGEDMLPLSCFLLHNVTCVTHVPAVSCLVCAQSYGR